MGPMRSHFVEGAAEEIFHPEGELIAPSKFAISRKKRTWCFLCRQIMSKRHVPKYLPCA